MAETIQYSWEYCQTLAYKLYQEMRQGFARRRGLPYKLYGVPRGGIHAAQLLMAEDAKCPETGIGFELAASPKDADIFVDDLIDSGATRKRYKDAYPDKAFYVLNDKQKTGEKRWIVYPWEIGEESTPTDAVIRLLQYIGEDPKRDGLEETPARVTKALREMTCGYSVDPLALLKTFDMPGSSDMVILKGIEFYSLCEHHMLPFYGVAHIGYYASGKVIGVSKLARLLNAFAKRLQVQERIAMQVVEALAEAGFDWAGCWIEARHLCMACRGVQENSPVMDTLTTTDPSDTDKRDEFIRRVHSNFVR